MFKEISPHKVTNVSGIVDADGPLSQLTICAIYRLRTARNYAEDTGRDAWEFAVTIGELRRDGVSENELRWLVCRGYVEHATELVARAGIERSFDRNVNLRF